jgi:hypothetical protein
MSTWTVRPVCCTQLAPTPPSRVRVLFVGVAPPTKARHFYTDPSDNLRRGLFAVLNELGRPCHDIHSFIARGFFLVHTAKCAIRGTTAPDVRVSKFCSSIHLRKEIECVAPDGLCFLSKNVGFPVYENLASGWGTARHRVWHPHYTASGR